MNHLVYLVMLSDAFAQKDLFSQIFENSKELYDVSFNMILKSLM